jgi:hypothetical protein
MYLYEGGCKEIGKLFDAFSPLILKIKSNELKNVLPSSMQKRGKVHGWSQDK